MEAKDSLTGKMGIPVPETQFEGPFGNRIDYRCQVKENVPHKIGKKNVDLS